MKILAVGTGWRLVHEHDQLRLHVGQVHGSVLHGHNLPLVGDDAHRLAAALTEATEPQEAPAANAADAGCVFCRIITGEEPATIVHRWPDALAIVPLGPVTDGHLLVIPTVHVRDALQDPDVTAAVMRRAAQIAPHPCNLITSAGGEATQSVWHLHVHVVPRRDGDGLALPWHPGSNPSDPTEVTR